MFALRPSIATVGYIDDYCLLYRSMFEDVRLYECFKWLHVGIISPLPRKTLLEIAKLNGLKDGQSLHQAKIAQRAKNVQVRFKPLLVMLLG